MPSYRVHCTWTPPNSDTPTSSASAVFDGDDLTPTQAAKKAADWAQHCGPVAPDTAIAVTVTHELDPVEPAAQPDVDEPGISAPAPASAPDA